MRRAALSFVGLFASMGLFFYAGGHLSPLGAVILAACTGLGLAAGVLAALRAPAGEWPLPFLAIFVNLVWAAWLVWGFSQSAAMLNR